MPDTLRLTDLTGGRNGADSPFAVPDDQVVEALNIDNNGGGFNDTRIARKRYGSSNVTINGFAADKIDFMSRHVPDDESAAELMAIQSTATNTIKRLAGGTVWASVTTFDAMTGAGRHDHTAASFNGKWFHGHDTAVNRLHCFDGTAHRRVGQGRTATTALSSVTAAGAVSDTRACRASLIVKSGAVVLRRSELTSAQIGSVYAGQQRTYSLVNVPAEGETHWELWLASAVNNYTTWHYAGEAAIGASIVDNATTLTGYAPPVAGTNLTPPSARFVIADDGRVVMAGSHEASASNTWEVAPSSKRVWWTAPPGHADISENPASAHDERIVITTNVKSYLDVEERITGLASPVNGVIYVFAYRSIWRLTATGDVQKPYQRRTITRSVGCIRHHSIVMAEDENGRPAIYFMTSRGPYRLTVGGGLEACYWDIRDLWVNINLNATIGPHGVYHGDKRQVWWWIPASGSDFPNQRIRLDTRKAVSTVNKGVIKGWYNDSGAAARARCSVLFSNTPGATMSKDLKPYIAPDDATPLLWKCDANATSDAGTPYTSYIKTKPYAPWGRDIQGRVTQPYITARVSGNVNVQMTLIKNHEKELQSDSVTLNFVGSEVFIDRMFESIDLSEIEYMQLQLGDAAAQEVMWWIDEIAVPWSECGATAVYAQAGQ
jgi:hypothetical protein